MQTKGIYKMPVTEKKTDWFLAVIVFILSVFGIVVIYSATRTLKTNTNVIVQSAAFVIGSAVMLFMSRFDYEQLKNMAKYIYIFAVLILIAVLLFGISGDWGARSWIRFGAIGIQPSEIAKVCFIVTFSYHLSKVEESINKIPVIIGLILHLGLLLGLIMLQPDLGSVLVFLFMFVCMLFTAKISWKYVAAALGAGIVSVPLIYKFLLSEYQKKRIQVFLNPDLDPLNRGYNVIQSKIAVGSGQIWGKGYLQGTQNQFGYLPTKYTDFIFSVIAEEFGLIGAVIVTVLLFMLILRCFKIAKKADNPFGRYICVGTASMLLFHTFENIGMCIGLMPVTGIPLPFISYGGTAMVTNMLAIGLVLSVSAHNKPRSVFDVY